MGPLARIWTGSEDPFRARCYAIQCRDGIEEEFMDNLPGISDEQILADSTDETPNPPHVTE